MRGEQVFVRNNIPKWLLTFDKTQKEYPINGILLSFFKVRYKKLSEYCIPIYLHRNKINCKLI